MKLSSVRKIWITLFSIVCMLTSSIAFSLPMMPMNMSSSSATPQAMQCNMQNMDHSAHDAMTQQGSIASESTSDCNNLSKSMQDCCTDNCATANCMATFALITSTHTDLLSLQSNALLFPTAVNSIISSTSSSLYRPPIL